MMVLTKSGFLEYSHCPKSYWVKVNRPDEVDWPSPDAYARMLMAAGYEVEALVKQVVAAWPNAKRCTFQVTFDPPGLEVRADLVCRNEDGSIDLYEIKSSTSIKGSTGDHVADATFQTAVIERSGTDVRAVHIIHVNKDYERRGDIDPHALLVIADVTDKVRAGLADMNLEIDQAIEFLAQPEIDERGCSCIEIGNPAKHCPTFSRFNRDIPSPSAYLLPRISKSKLVKFHQEGRLALDRISPEELTGRQILVHRAALTGAPVINPGKIAAFLGELKWPFYFYDYETFGSAIPIADGHRPHQQIPVQFSVHRLDANGDLTHHEFLAEAPGMEGDLVAALESCIGPEGTLVSWHMSTEVGCNDRMAALLPAKAEFLADLNARTVDLMVPFEEDYVDARFEGFTSIKKVLPILVPALAYSKDDVHDGTGAMQAWLRMIRSDDPNERADLRRQLLEYCQLDTLAMVEIYRVLRELNVGSPTQE